MEKKANFDVVIAGGGPAGLSALQWCIDLGMAAVLIEKEAELGGQLLRIFNPIRNYLGVEAADGREMRDIFVRHLVGTDRVMDAAIVEADLARKTITTADGIRYSGRAVIIATGVRRRALDIPGERKFVGRGVLSSGAKQRNEVAGKCVVIVGGGDAALENALVLSDMAEKVVVIHRRDVFTARQSFLDEASRKDKIEFLTETRVVGISGDEIVTSVELEDIKTGSRRTLAADAVLIRAGVIPNTELFRAQIAMDRAGYITIDGNCKTDLANIYAIGDAANPEAPTIAAAVGQASIAAKAIHSKTGRK